ncbi:hypothetical protein H0H92_000502, partial [Tricholoma furcatifolium]
YADVLALAVASPDQALPINSMLLETETMWPASDDYTGAHFQDTFLPLPPGPENQGQDQEMPMSADAIFDSFFNTYGGVDDFGY